jgi:N-acyl-D-aspartate/D-glutamate deacylase
MIRKWLIVFMALIFIVFPFAGHSKTESEDYDILVKNGKIIDGTGNPWFFADIGIKGDTIAAIGHLSEKTAAKIIDAKGLIVCPGFIDLHSHCDSGLGEIDSNVNLNYLIQGATTVVTGNCASGTFRIKETKEKWERQGIGTNAIHLVGHGDVRREVMGTEPRNPTQEELEKMKMILRQAMREGAWGISTGLEYIPSRYADTEEIIELTSVAGEFGGVHSSHMRAEAELVLDAIKEIIRVGEETGVRINTAHFKVMGKDLWGGVMEDAVKLINDAPARGIYYTVDMYPYDQAGGAPLISIERNAGWSCFRLPGDMEPFAELREQMKNKDLTNSEKENLKKQYIDELAKALSDSSKRERIKESVLFGEPPHNPSPVAIGGWHNFVTVVSRKNPQLIGKIFSDLPAELGRDIFDIVADLVIDEPDMYVSYGVMSEDDMIYAMKEDWLMFSSDGGAMPIVKEGDKPYVRHPRAFGSQARVLRKYVREDKVLTLAKAIKKMTSLPASFLQIKDRGLILKGFKADIAVFDPEKITDNSTWADSRQYSTGTEFVIVNGKISIEKGKYNGALNGRLLLLTENK